MTDNHPADAAPDDEKVVNLTDSIMRDGPVAVTELERKRSIAFRAFELTASQLEHDALEMEKAAIVGEHDLKRRHELMGTAQSLRVATEWIRKSLLPLPPQEPSIPSPNNVN